jgi:hypothetical protein
MVLVPPPPLVRTRPSGFLGSASTEQTCAASKHPGGRPTSFSFLASPSLASLPHFREPSVSPSWTRLIHYAVLETALSAPMPPP